MTLDCHPRLILQSAGTYFKGLFYIQIADTQNCMRLQIKPHRKDWSKPVFFFWPLFVRFNGRMEIKSTLTNRSGQRLKVIYREDNPLQNLEGKVLSTVHAFCFCDGKLVIVYSPEKKYWTPPGGA